MNVEFLKTQRTNKEQIVTNLNTDATRSELGDEVVGAKILKLKEEIKILNIQINHNE